MAPEPTPEAGPLDPDGARHRPTQAVDALEHDVLGDSDHRRDETRPHDDPDRETDDTDAAPAPAFELDLDPEDQGSADAGASSPD